MNFFEHQAVARKKTGQLVILIALAIVGVILSIYFIAALIIGLVTDDPQAQVILWDPGLFVLTAAGVVIVIFMGSAYKTAQLSSGGQAVAEMLGGRLLSRTTKDPGEKRLLNVVEEMAIASGAPVPPVYVLDDSSINAFAAGFTPGDAVIGVTRGCVERLTRDELQGVIAHEFSHIFNGDMRLNIRIIGLIHGLVVISMIGYILLRLLGETGGGKDLDKLAVVLALFGLALYIIGSVGAFFGSLIRASISRQREYLADSSAVQFTRNPGGIAGALKKIAGVGSQIRAEHAKEASHLYFSTGVSSLFATHPPIEDRIARILQLPVEAVIVGRPDISGAASAGVMGFTSGKIISSMGKIDQAHINHARAALEKLPAALTDSLADPLGAVSTLYGLLVQNEATAKWIEENSEPDFAAMIMKMQGICAGMGREKRLMIVDLALPSLKLLSKAQLAEFRFGLRRIIDADKDLSLFEFAVERMIAHHLDPDRRGASAVKFTAWPRIRNETLLIVSAVAHMSHHEADEVTRAFGRGLETLTIRGSIVAREECTFEAIDKALTILAQASPDLKEKITEAVLEAAGVDGFITVEEAEMVRAIAASLDAPVPPIHPTPTEMSGCARV
jgi:Zn-dependent protease with chaperone function